MMEEYPDNALAILEAMEGPLFDGLQMRRYSYALSQLHPNVGYRVVCEMCLKRWRPSPHEILVKACCLYAPRPEEDQVFGEIMTQKSTWGGRAVGMVWTDDTRTRARPAREGEPWVFRMQDYSIPPIWSHSIVAEIVESFGGWAVIASGEAHLSGGFRKQLETAYNRIVERYNERVLPMLGLQDTERVAALARIGNRLAITDLRPVYDTESVDKEGEEDA